MKPIKSLNKFEILTQFADKPIYYLWLMNDSRNGNVWKSNRNLNSILKRAFLRNSLCPLDSEIVMRFTAMPLICQFHEYLNWFEIELVSLAEQIYRFVGVFDQIMLHFLFELPHQMLLILRILAGIFCSGWVGLWFKLWNVTASEHVAHSGKNAILPSHRNRMFNTAKVLHNLKLNSLCCCCCWRLLFQTNSWKNLDCSNEYIHHTYRDSGHTLIQQNANSIHTLNKKKVMLAFSLPTLQQSTKRRFFPILNQRCRQPEKISAHN